MPTEVILRHLSFAYNHHAPVLKDVSLDIFHGEFIGIIGPNGGGKTTLLKIIMGFLNPTHGWLEVCGGTPQSAQKQIAYVPQNIQFDRQFPISVFELVLTGRLSHLPWYGCYSSQDKAASMEAIEMVGLTKHAHRAFGTLSGGQAQRALIARAIVSKPRLLLLDEPTAMVDSRAENEIYEILKSLRGTMTLLMVTHDLNVVISQVDRILCIQKEATSLTPQEVCEHYALGLYHSPLLRTNLSQQR